VAIVTSSARPERTQLGFVSELPPLAFVQDFERRGYTCHQVEPKIAQDGAALAAMGAIVISQQPNKLFQVRNDLESLAETLDRDCRIYVRYLTSTPAHFIVLKALSDLKLPLTRRKHDFATYGLPDPMPDETAPLFSPFVHIEPIAESNDDWRLVANHITHNPAGRSPNLDLDIRPKKLALSVAQRLLLQRAFADCSGLELRPKMDGLSGALAFEAFAYLRSDVVGDRAPYRCFVKLGPRNKVAQEYHNYQHYALENIPFHLGPRLRSERCMLGQSWGVIVCDFVAGAQTLRDCVKDGRGVPSIGNLFNQTLIGFRRGAGEEEVLLQDLLARFLEGRSDVPDHRQAAIKALGAKKSLDELKALIARSLPSTPVLTGIVHGDLHATNVFVRFGDAVVIDLERVTEGLPMLLDPASLEAGLFIDGFINDPRSPAAVLKSLRPLYEAEALLRDDHYCDPSQPSFWFFDSVRQIRMQAKQMELKPYQYAWTLAAVLLHKACNDRDFSSKREGPRKCTRQNVRGMAFVLAETIILQLHAAGETSP
jgi:hypothetical protein